MKPPALALRVRGLVSNIVFLYYRTPNTPRFIARFIASVDTCFSCVIKLCELSTLRCPVFGRIQADRHKYESALEEWVRPSSTLEFRAVARNIMHDHRVSPARERSFDRFGGEPGTANELQAAFKDYFREKVRARHSPAFLDSDNANNMVSGSADEPLPSDLPLARVLDLSGLGLVFAEARRIGMPEFQEFTPDRLADPREEEINTFLGSKLNVSTQREPFINAILSAMNHYRRTKPYQPAWATTWASFEEYAHEAPERWLEVLGIPRPAFPRWLLILRYTVGEAGTVIRPTQLDAGWGADHFPSPPQASARAGGHPVDLQTEPPAVRLLPEFIHQQIEHNLAHWISGRRLCSPTVKTVGGSLESERIAHHALLKSSYGPAIRRWMPFCV